MIREQQKLDAIKRMRTMQIGERLTLPKLCIKERFVDDIFYPRIEIVDEEAILLLRTTDANIFMFEHCIAKLSLDIGQDIVRWESCSLYRWLTDSVQPQIQKVFQPLKVAVFLPFVQDEWSSNYLKLQNYKWLDDYARRVKSYRGAITSWWTASCRKTNRIHNGQYIDITSDFYTINKDGSLLSRACNMKDVGVAPFFMVVDYHKEVN